MDSRTVTARTAPSRELGKNATAQATTTVGVKYYIIIEKWIKYKKKWLRNNAAEIPSWASAVKKIALAQYSAKRVFS